MEDKPVTNTQRAFVLSVTFLLVFGILALVGIPAFYMSRSRAQPSGGIGVVEIAASQTARALQVSPTPPGTPLPGYAYWYPLPTGTSTLRFEYNSGRWARTDVNTFASLQIVGCTLRRAGGRGLGPDWSTAESSLQAGEIDFLVIVSKYRDVSQFITYSGPDGTVFEISGPLPLDTCRQAGESVIKSGTVY